MRYPGKEAEADAQIGLDRIAAEFAPLGSPIILFNAAHSGSSLLADALAEAGVFMGAERNPYGDATAIVPLVRQVVERHMPDVGRINDHSDPVLSAVAVAAFAEHLKGRLPGAPWGWKLGETVFIVPLLARLFPTARFVHVVRDGRDVAFSPFLAPKDPFWRKVHFNTDRITSWHGLAMTQRAYRARGPLFNAIRWVNSASLGRAYGAMLGPRYREVRYEDLVSDFATVVTGLCDWLEISATASSAAHVHARSVGKWRKQPRREIEAVMAILEPTLTCFSYGDGGPVPMFRRDPLWRRLLWS
ncbi:MAG: sulfotransferase [Bauldia sp.]